MVGVEVKRLVFCIVPLCGSLIVNNSKLVHVPRTHRCVRPALFTKVTVVQSQLSYDLLSMIAFKAEL